MSSQLSTVNERTWPEPAAAIQAWDHLSYKVRVRGSATPIYLWGSAGITQIPTLPPSLLLHIRNDEHGEVISLGTTGVNGATTPIGTLQPGECFSLPLQNTSGVYATCALDSVISCSVKHS